MYVYNVCMYPSHLLSYYAGFLLCFFINTGDFRSYLAAATRYSGGLFVYTCLYIYVYVYIYISS